MKSTKLFQLGALLLLSIGILAGCNSGNVGDNGNSESKGKEDSLSGSLIISGSSAMQPLVAAAAEEFMAKHPGADVQVNAGGSGTGLSEVSRGTVAIGNSDVFAEEKDGIPADELVDHKVAVVGMGPVINPESGLTNISKDNLIKVFTGEITNWSELGGTDQDIVLVNRPDSSGTRATFVKFGLDGATPSEGVTDDSSNTVKKIIAETPGAIGYLAFSYLDDSVTALSLDKVEPSDKNVQSGEFPIWAYEHSYTKGEAEGLTKAFLDFMLGDEIQEGLVPEQGYIPATKMEVSRDASGQLTESK